MSPGANPRRGISKSRARKPTSDVSPRRGARPKYSESFRHKVVKYSIKNGIARAADRFEVSTPSVTNWRKLYGVTRKTKIQAEKGQKISLPKQPIPKQERRSTGRKYSAQFRRECEYCPEIWRQHAECDQLAQRVRDQSIDQGETGLEKHARECCREGNDPTADQRYQEKVGSVSPVDRSVDRKELGSRS